MLEHGLGTERGRPMNEPQAMTGFDAAERERIRRALLRYMKERRIGVPALLPLIIKSHPREMEMTLSTLQRFLKARHQTQDHYVALCQGFVKHLPYYGEGRDIPPLGAALCGFFERLDDGDAAAPAFAIERFVGAFEGRSRHGAMRPRVGVARDFAPLASHASLAAVPGKAFLEMRELVIDRQEGRDRRFAFDGVLLFVAPLFYAVLRNSLTRQPKVYSLEAVPAPERGPDALSLKGNSFEVVVPDDRKAQRFRRSADIQFYPVAAERLAT